MMMMMMMRMMRMRMRMKIKMRMMITLYQPEISSRGGGSGGTRGGGEVAIPILREPWNLQETLVVCKGKLHSFSTRLSSNLEAAKWRSGNNELCEHVMYYMQTVMHALCRHVPKSGLQTDTNFLRVGTCSYFSQEALSL